LLVGRNSRILVGLAFRPIRTMAVPRRRQAARTLATTFVVGRPAGGEVGDMPWPKATGRARTAASMSSPREMSASAAARREPRVDVATVAAEEVGTGSAEVGVDTVAAEEVGVGSAEVGVDSVAVVVSAGVDLVGLSPGERHGVKVNDC